MVVGTTQILAQIIPANRVIDWTQVGANLPIPARTSLIDVTQPPYSADNTGATDATAAIQAAINAAAPNQVVYIPDGQYLIARSLYTTKSYITIRGHTNSVLVGVGNSGSMLRIGPDRSNYMYNPSDTITSGATQGSTQFQTLQNPPLWFGVGDQITISDTVPGSSDFPVIGVHGNQPGLAQEVIVTAISGNTVTLSDPLIWNFTNAPIVIATGNPSTVGVGLENLILTASNSLTGQLGTYYFQMGLSMCENCWVSNCADLYSSSYAFYVGDSAHLSIVHNAIQRSQGSGMNHAGFILSAVGESLFADNIISDGMQPGIEFNGGFSGNAMVGNFLTNNIIDVDNHGPHPMMNLWEENVLSGYFEMDGFFGSGSHQTLYRNSIGSSYMVLLFKRWTTYMNVVGNVLGSPAGNYANYTSEANQPGPMIIESGYPNIGNDSYTSVSGPSVPWNYPVTSYPNPDGLGQVYPSPICTIGSDQGPTNVLQGNFTNITQTIAWNGGSEYALVFQDAVNTNLYYPTNGTVVYATSAGTPNSVTLNTPFAVKNGWQVFIVSQNTYQQLQRKNKYTDEITGNYDYYNHAVTWDTNGVQTIPASLIYPNGAPAWWGTNRWPAIDPLNSMMTAVIPAQYRYTYGAGPTLTASGQGLQPPSNLQVFPAQ
jgi:hypothetical protein